MSTSLVVLLVVLVGFQFAAQAPINGGLGRTVGPLTAAFVSFSIGTVALGLICLGLGQMSGFASIGDAPLWQLAGGFIGATYVALAAITISRIGAGVIAAVTVTGQLACSVAIDHFGWFGIEAHDVTGPRVLGLALLLVGAMAMLYSRGEATKNSAPKAANRERILICLAIFVASLGVGVQHPLNAELAVTIGDLPAGLVNFVVGTVLLAAVASVSGKMSGVRHIAKAERRYLLGGIIGVGVVVGSLWAVPKIGAAALTSALITGQMIGSLALDRVGAFGLTRIPIDRVRLVAAVALLAGTYLASG